MTRQIDIACCQKSLKIWLLLKQNIRFRKKVFQHKVETWERPTPLNSDQLPSAIKSEHCYLTRAVYSLASDLVKPVVTGFLDTWVWIPGFVQACTENLLYVLGTRSCVTSLFQYTASDICRLIGLFIWNIVLNVIDCCTRLLIVNAPRLLRNTQRFWTV